MNGKKSLAPASGQEQRLIREIQAVIDTHMKFTTAIFFSPPSLRNRIKKVLSKTEYQFLLPHRNQDYVLSIESSRNIGFSLCIRNLISLRVMLSFARVLPAK